MAVLERILAVLCAAALLWSAPGPAFAASLYRVAATASPIAGGAPMGLPSALTGGGGTSVLGTPLMPGLPPLTPLPTLSAPPAVRPGQSPAAVPVLNAAGVEVARSGGAFLVNGVAVPSAEQVADLGDGAAKESGERVMDAVLGRKLAAPADAPIPEDMPAQEPPSGGLSAPSGPDGAPSPAARSVPAPKGPPAGALGSFLASAWRRCASFLSSLAGGVYAVRILHLHYPHRSWENVVRDMQNDDKIKATNGEHPAGALREILNRTGWRPENPAGLSISFTPALMEIARRLWGDGWIARWREAAGWKTGSGSPRMEMLLTGFHFLYGLLPGGRAGEALVDWNVGYHETLNRELWGEPEPGRMKIFRPPEVGFSAELVPALVKAGVQVVVVDSHHISRALEGYDASGMPAVTPPNKADQRTRSPYPLDYRTVGQDGRNTKDALPYTYLPHWLRYVDPADGKEYRIIVFPMTGGPSYIAGYKDFPTELVADAAKSGVPGRPLVMGLDTDGDNAWGGGYSSYMEAMPRLAHWLGANGHAFGTIEEYLKRYPVPPDDVLDWVEPGAWPNADWGSPQLHRWLWPPMKPGSDVQGPAFDPAAWNFKLQFHALLTMAVHYLLQGEAALRKQDPGWKPDMGRIVKADSAPAGPWEAAVQTVLRAFDSGHVYYGPEPDFLQIPLRAAKAAADAAARLLAGGESLVGPTIWGPSRFPWNPGGENRGELYGWRPRQYGPEFDAYGFVFSAAGVKRARLKWRVSADGRTAPRRENLLYAQAPGAGAWNASDMELRDPYAQVDWKGLPAAERVSRLPLLAHAHVRPGEDVLVDYYIEAEDAQGKVERSPILHVWVGR